MAKRTGNSRYLREMNVAQLLEMIRNNEGISRIALAEKTGLSATAIGSIVKTLIEEHYVYETGTGRSSGGRRPTMLKLQPGSWYGAGVDIDIRFLYMTVMDHAGNSIWERQELLEPVAGASVLPKDMLDHVVQLYQQMLLETGLSPSTILGFGVSVPGMIDRKTQIVTFAPNLGWRNVDVKEILEQRLHLKVLVENESVCSAICEKWMGSCREAEDFIHMNIDTGIGAGMFLKGSLYRGTGGSAGEVGHIIVQEDGPLCTCGNNGCLETLASLDAMVKAAGLNDFSTFLTRVQEGQADCVAVMEQASKGLGRAVAMLVNTLNPKKVVLGKRFPEYAALAMATVQKEVERLALKSAFSQVDVVIGSFGEESSSVGAAILPIRQLMQPQNG